MFGHRYERRYLRGYSEEDAQNIIEKRYARGEITREQYSQMMDDLQKRRTTQLAVVRIESIPNRGEPIALPVEAVSYTNTIPGKLYLGTEE